MEQIKKENSTILTFSSEQENNSNDLITTLRIVDGKKTIFQDNYIIPIYQRAFSWGEGQIKQLLEDIADVNTPNYYLGSLIVKKTTQNQYEVIDGQQRLTALYLILSYLHFNDTTNNIIPENRLSFEQRPTSDLLLDDIQNIIVQKKDSSSNTNYSDKQNNNIIQGLKIIKEYFNSKSEKKDKIKNNLSKAVLYRIEVPEHTDLNKYFEIMNTRGEQLEQQDIIKAKLMGFLSTEKTKTENNEQLIFAKIWDACQNIDSYMVKNLKPPLRKKLFGDNSSALPTIDDKIFEDKDLIDSLSNTEKENENDEDKSIRFESIIDFPVFLLHVLKVYKKVNNLDTSEDTYPLDTQKLCKNFDTFLENENKDDKYSFAKGFILLLLKCRFLFDNFIIKRRFDSNTNKDGKWSLQYYHKKNKSAYYTNTFSDKRKENDNDIDDDNTDTILMLQSCLRVSITSPKIMHWITETIIFLFEQLKANTSANSIETFAIELIKNKYSEQIESIIQRNDKLNSFLTCKNANNVNEYNQGVATPHIVFNYLDYLLWKEINFDFNLIKRNNIPNLSKLKEDLEKFNKDLKDFKFEYRTTVEHWYPRHPKNEENWTKNHDEDVNMFGNLSILARSDNADFSNAYPKAKKDQFKDKINNGSLKLRLMSIATDENVENIVQAWTKDKAQIHQDQMIALLNAACCSIKSSEDKQ